MTASIPNILADRYASSAMRDLWSPEGKVILEREFWIAVMKAQRDLGVDVPADAIEASFSVGLSTLPEVLAAQYSLADAQSTRITSRADLLTASAALIYATGDLRSKDGRENRRRNTLGG